MSLPSQLYTSLFFFCLYKQLLPTAQNSVYTRESSVQRSAQVVFNITLKLPASTIKNVLTNWPFDKTVRLLLHLDQICIDHVFTGAHVSIFIFTHSNRFGLLTVLGSKLPRERRACGIVTSLSPTFTPANRTAIIIPNNQNSSHQQTKNDQCENSHGNTSEQIPVFLGKSVISGFQDQINHPSISLPLYEPLALVDSLDVPYPSPSLPFPWPTLLDHDLLCSSLAVAFAWCDTSIEVSLKKVSTVLETTIPWTT